MVDDLKKRLESGYYPENKILEDFDKAVHNLYNSLTGERNSVKGIQTTFKNTKDVVDDFTTKQEENKKE